MLPHGRRFCAYCLEDCGVGEAGSEAAHSHVNACAHAINPGIFAQLTDFEEVQRRRRKRMVQKYLNSIDDVDIRQRVVTACASDFADHQLGIVLATTSLS